MSRPDHTPDRHADRNALTVCYLLERPRARGRDSGWAVAKALDNVGGLARVADLPALVMPLLPGNVHAITDRGLRVLLKRRTAQLVQFDSVASVRSALHAGNPFVRLIEHVERAYPNRFDHRNANTGANRCPLCRARIESAEIDFDLAPLVAGCACADTTSRRFRV